MMNQDFISLDHFDGGNLTRCKDKLKFMLTALIVFYILDQDLTQIPPPNDDYSNDLITQRKKRKEDEVVCRVLILNSLSNHLYDLYTSEKSSLNIWNVLEFIYKVEEAVGAIVAKLRSSCDGYRKELIHDSKYFNLEELQKHLRIEEEPRGRKKNDESFNGNNKANEQTKFNKIKKVDCFVCKKSGHYARGCKFKKVHKSETNSLDLKSNIGATINQNTCATVHVCYDKSLLKIYITVDDGQEVQIGNEVRFKVIVILTNVLHVLDMNRNLVSGDLLSKPRINSVYESGKFILSRNGIFVGKWISCNGMIKLYVVLVENNNKVDFAYMAIL
ncbi:RNA-directed DNA polymerase protein [Dioscorea alata]|uniref:RNA-directed DNA polymerase protein n=1 Tax=Dioscorea alata TaxID=55571 RepID=A0ACB7UHS0_DIOAL|nr:RNA-directed DNA polymerase protein [Dioscorea alata]